MFVILFADIYPHYGNEDWTILSQRDVEHTLNRCEVLGYLIECTHHLCCFQQQKMEHESLRKMGQPWAHSKIDCDLQGSSANIYSQSMWDAGHRGANHLRAYLIAQAVWVVGSCPQCEPIYATPETQVKMRSSYIGCKRKPNLCKWDVIYPSLYGKFRLRYILSTNSTAWMEHMSSS